MFEDMIQKLQYFDTQKCRDDTQNIRKVRAINSETDTAHLNIQTKAVLNACSRYAAKCDTSDISSNSGRAADFR